MRWLERAVCATMTDLPPEVFFPEIERGNHDQRVWDRAKEICQDCPVKMECLEYQMKFEEESGRRDGMWGGLTPKQREHLFWERMKPRH